MDKTNQEIAKEVWQGLWGNGLERRSRLEAAGYNYQAVQSIVNSLSEDEIQVAQDEFELPKKPPLEIDYDVKNNDGIIVNIIL